MGRTKALARQLILLGLVTIQALFIFQLQYQLFQAQVCNRAFQIYLETNYGITVDLNHLYRSAKGWLY